MPGYRAIGNFIERNQEDLLKYLQPDKVRLPSFDTVRRVLNELDFKAFSFQFHEWAKERIHLEPGEWVSLDGKAIGGTVSNANSSLQHFISLVSLYCNQQKLVLGNGRVINSKESEIPVVLQLIQQLDIEGVTFTLDALHCQKKRQKSSLKAETII